MDRKIRVAVLYGGQSGEHEVSLLSARSILQHLDRERFSVTPIGIDRQGAWFPGKDPLGSERALVAPLCLPEDRTNPVFHPAIISGSPFQPPEKSVHDVPFDVIFPAVHGTLCEDGTLQGLLEQAGVAYVGCGVLSSAVGMDKDVSKRLAAFAGVKTPAFVALKREQWDLDPQKWSQHILQKLPLPVFVKPANTGSSVGVEKIHTAEELSAAITRAFQYDTKVIVEQGIDAIELEIAVLESLTEGEDPIVSEVAEIRSHHEFYSYAAKYLDENGAEYIIPAAIDADAARRARDTAKKIFNEFGCEGHVRVDLFLERGTNEILFNEINTLPGFTAISMYPRLMEASGIPYSELLSRLIDLALKKQARRKALCREYRS